MALIDDLLSAFGGKVKTYDFREWQITVMSMPVTGFAEEDAFSIEWSGEWFTPRTGLDGEMTRNFVNNRLAKVTLKLMQSSDCNGQLLLALLADVETSKVNTTTFAVSITSLSPNGGTYRSDNCWIERPPTISGARESSVLEWVFCCPDMPPLIS